MWVRNTAGNFFAGENIVSKAQCYHEASQHLLHLSDIGGVHCGRRYNLIELPTIKIFDTGKYALYKGFGF